jgi:hypothetical protein
MLNFAQELKIFYIVCCASAWRLASLRSCFFGAGCRMICSFNFLQPVELIDPLLDGPAAHCLCVYSPIQPILCLDTLEVEIVACCWPSRLTLPRQLVVHDLECGSQGALR